MKKVTDELIGRVSCWSLMGIITLVPIASA
jgi:hypothetical protein